MFWLHSLCVFPRGTDAPSLSHAQLEPRLQLPKLLPPTPTQSTFKRLKHLNTRLLGRRLIREPKQMVGEINYHHWQCQWELVVFCRI